MFKALIQFPVSENKTNNRHHHHNYNNKKPKNLKSILENTISVFQNRQDGVNPGKTKTLPLAGGD